MFARAPQQRPLECLTDFDPAAPATRFQGPPGCALPSRRKHALTTTNIIALVCYPRVPYRRHSLHHILYDVTIVIIVADSAPFASTQLQDNRSCIGGGWIARTTERWGIATAFQERAHTRSEFRDKIIYLLARGHVFAHDLSCDIRLLISTITDSSQWDHPMPKQHLYQDLQII